MAERKTVRTSDVTDAIKFFLATSIVFRTDDEGYVTRTDQPNTRYRYTLPSGEQKELMVYTEVAPAGVLVINPFAEGQGLTTPSQTFLYRVLRVAAIARITTIILGAVRFMQSQKGIKFNDPAFADLPASKPMLDLVGGQDENGKPIIDHINDKSFSEIRTFLERKDVRDDLISIVYNKSQGISKLQCDIVENQYFTDVVDLGKMRKVSFTVVKALLANLLTPASKNKTFEDYTVRRPSRDVPGKFYTWMSVLYNVYSSINELLDVIDPEMVVDLSVFSYHLDNFPAYHGNAAWQLQHNEASYAAKPQHGGISTPVTSPVGHVPSAAPHIPTPGQVGVQQQGAYQQPQQQSQVQLPGMPVNQPVAYGQPQGPSTTVPGPVRVDGSQAPPMVVPSVPAYQQGAYQQPVGMIGAPPQQPMMPGMMGYAQPQMGMVPGMMPGMMPGMQYQMPQQPINPMMGMGYPGGTMMGGYSSVPGVPFGVRY